jgi:hypothetical protein
MRPDSIFEKSRTSLMIASNDSPLPRTVSTYSACSASSCVSSRRLVIPMIAFIGVRISWLMFARNDALARAAASAASFAARSARCEARKVTTPSSNSRIDTASIPSGSSPMLSRRSGGWTGEATTNQSLALPGACGIRW